MGEHAAEEFEMAAKTTPHEDNVEKILQHFDAPPAEDIGRLAEKSLTEELLAEYNITIEKIKALEAIKAMLNRQIKELLGDERTKQIGSYCAFQSIQRQVRVNWEAYVLDIVGEDSLKEVAGLKEMARKGQGDSKYLQVTEVRKLEIKRMG